MTQYKHKRWGDIVTVEDGKVVDMPARFLTDEWEKYEEPKGVYFINSQGDVHFWDSTSFAFPDDWTKEIEIGNYFSSREEAELAVRKLKAWKRLKDKGIKFEEWDIENSDGAHQPGAFFNEDIFRHIDSYREVPELIKQDLDLLFRTEEVNLVERIDNLTDKQRKLILRMTKDDMDAIIYNGGEE